MVSEICVLILTVGAAVMDMKMWKIRNWWLLSWLAGVVIYNVSANGWESVAGILIGLLVPLLLLGWIFYLRMMGAGDIKLFCVVGAWIGAERILFFMLFAFVIGMVICVAKFIRHGTFKQRICNLGSYFKTLALTGTRISYGIKAAGKSRVHVAFLAAFSAVLMMTGMF